MSLDVFMNDVKHLCHQKQIASALPPASAASALKDSPVVMELRELLGKVDAIKNEREVTESEIKNVTSDIRKLIAVDLPPDNVPVRFTFNSVDWTTLNVRQEQTLHCKKRWNCLAEDLKEKKRWPEDGLYGTNDCL